MSINFKLLVEALLNENLKKDLTDGINPNVSQNPLLMASEEAVKILKSSGANYVKVDTLLGFKPLWPLIDTTAFIFKTLLDYKLIKTIDVNTARNFVADLNDPQVNTVDDFIVNGNTVQINDLTNAFQGNPQKEQAFLKVLQDRVDYLKNNRTNYRDYFLVRLKQLNDKTQMLAAEQYLPSTPYSGLTQLLKEYGGYDMRLVDNIIKYPGETKFTQKSNIEGPVMVSVVEISKLMLVFYREYITEADAAIKQALVQKIGVADDSELIIAVNNSAGKLTAPNKIIQQDYNNFVQGKSQFILEMSNTGVQTNKPLIGKIGDFQGLTDTGQEVFQAYLHLFNNIKKGTFPSKWQIAGKIVGSVTQGLEDIGSALARF